jgi:hypothetical protein
MDKKGLGVVVGTMLIVLITVVAIGILWVGYNKLINKGASENSLDCTTLDLNVLSCSFFLKEFSLEGSPALDAPGILANFKRELGDGELESIRIVAHNYDGKVYVLEPQEISIGLNNFGNNYVGMPELTTSNAAHKGDIDEWPEGLITHVGVAAVIEGGNVCLGSREPTPCSCYGPLNGPFEAGGKLCENYLYLLP